MEKGKAIQILRKNIILCINKMPSTTYELSSLLWADAAKCFPTSYSFNWDGAWFKLDLITQKLYADVGTYPNQFGACREHRYNLTADEFHQKALEFNMAEELQCMETEADWQELFDVDLKSAIDKVQKILEEEHDKQKRQQQILNAVVIPDEYLMIKPKMVFDRLQIELQQRYGTSSVWLINENEKYILRYWYSATYSSHSENSQRELSPSESAWLEQQVNDCIRNQDATTWQSLPGGDVMSVEICAQGKKLVEFNSGTPLNKYFELQHLLRKLAAYGSFTETEMKKITK